VARVAVAAVKTAQRERVVLVTRQAHLQHRGQLVGLVALVEFFPLAVVAVAVVLLV
jgi:hypothetical protein